MTTSNLRDCPNCFAPVALAEHNTASESGSNKLYICVKCQHVFAVDSSTMRDDYEDVLTDISPALEKFRLGDDRVRAALSSGHVRTLRNIRRVLDKNKGVIRGCLDEMVTSTDLLVAQVEQRARFLHTGLAELALVNPAAEPLLATAQQILDLVASQPDGVPESGGSASG